MTLCHCTQGSLSKVPDMRAMDFSVVEKFTDPSCGKACVLPNGRVEVLKSVWDRASSAERAWLLAHECAHKYVGVICEPCCDRVAGAILRKWGFSRQSVVDAGNNLIQSRSMAGRATGVGYDAAPSSADANKEALAALKCQAALVEAQAELADLVKDAAKKRAVEKHDAALASAKQTKEISAAKVSGGKALSSDDKKSALQCQQALAAVRAQIDAARAAERQAQKDAAKASAKEKIDNKTPEERAQFFKDTAPPPDLRKENTNTLLIAGGLVVVFGVAAYLTMKGGT